jgi:EF-P beta-lysylation protein EpmB
MTIVAVDNRSVRANGRPDSDSWQQALRTAIRDPIRLCRHLRLPPQYESGAVNAARDFPVFAPLALVAKMKSGDPHDPLLRQVLPLADELQAAANFTNDPVGDVAAAIGPGLLHKYHGRALMVTTGACAVHCRYCFRRHYPYDAGPHSIADWQPALAQLAADPTIEEILLSGGDPLMLVDFQLQQLIIQLTAISHLRRLRIHTRLPIMIPERVTDALITALRTTRLTAIMVIHANHPAELDEPVVASVARLIDAGVPLLNQSVLMRGVNDDAEVLAELSRRLIDSRVMPYYLHQLDRVAGAAHFEVPISRGRELIELLRTRLPGYAVPRYVQEIPGEGCKRLLA